MVVRIPAAAHPPGVPAIRQVVRAVPAVREVGAVEAVEAETRFTIQWHITERCNCRCLHCYQEEASAESSPQQLERFLTRIENFFNQRQGIITVTGGEPLLHPAFFTLLEKLNHPYGVLSNGTLIDVKTAALLAERKPAFVQISIEGKEKTHDYIRGRGTYRAALEGIKNLRQVGIRVLISFTAHQKNYLELPAVARLGRRLGVDKVWVDRMIPAGNGCGISGLNMEQSRQLFFLMKKSRVAMDRALQFLAGGRPYKCQAGISLMAIVPGGDVYPCRRMPITAGNLINNTLEEIYQGEVMKRLRNEKSEGCFGCLYEKICRGGLRCLAYALTGSPFNPDPACWIADNIKKSKEEIAKAPPLGAIIANEKIRFWKRRK